MLWYGDLRARSFPIPSSVDFSTNTLQQLAFWQGFCLNYHYWATHEWRQSIRTPGYVFSDPYWFEYPDRIKGWDLAETLAFRRYGRKELPEAEVPKWVETNYAQFYSDADKAVLILRGKKDGMPQAVRRN